MPRREFPSKRGKQDDMVSGARGKHPAATVVLSALLLCATAAGAQRTELKPGWNLFSPKTDIEVGQRAAQDAKKKLPMCNDPKVSAYLTQLGKRLAEKAPTAGIQYPFEFHCVNDKAINAFALPGGFVFINRGAIEAADTEAQLAGVMAHEISHVALRHGTNQASKAVAAQFGLGAFGGLFGGSNMGAFITQLGSFTAGSVLLKYSRTAETQADVMGTQILYDAGYDPRAMAQFFEKLQAKGGQSGSLAQFFSDHPNPDHRIERVDEEVEKLGGPPQSYKRDSTEFQAIRRQLLAMPVVKTKLGASAVSGAPSAPSSNFVTYQGRDFSLQYPDNWKKYGEGDAVTFAPDGGVVRDRNGKAALAYGVIINMAAAREDSNDAHTLEEYTDRLIDQLQQANPGMRVLRKRENARLNGQPALSTHLSNTSPAGGQETDWVLTVMRPDGLLYFVCVAPQKDFSDYDKAFTAILDSVRLNH